MTGAPPPRDALLYCDTSALARAYLADESEYGELRELLLERGERVVTSALTEIELVAAISAAARAGRIRRPDLALAQATSDLGPGGPILLIALDGGRVLPRARELCERHRLRTMDALHLAVGLTSVVELAAGDDVVFVTREADQAAAALAEGLQVE